MNTELRTLLILGALSMLVAFVGCTSEIDPIGLWILKFVEGMDEFAWLRPYQLPEPANNEYGFRPGSVLLLRSYVQIFGTGIPHMVIVFLKAFFSAWLFAIASWRWLRINGMQASAFPVACLVIFLSPHLFGLWCLAELDGLGAAGILGVSILLAKSERMWLDQISIGVLIAFSALLKESAALILFAVMAAECVQAYRHRRPYKERLKWLMGSSLIWLFWASFLIFGTRSQVGEASWGLRLPLMFFTAWQLVFFSSLSGAVLLLSSLVPRHQKNITWGGVAILLLAPPLLWINHYEAMYYSPLWLGILSCVLLYGCLFWLAFGSKQRKKHAGVALTILFAKGALMVALLLSSAPREDLATRIFLPVAPMVVGLIVERALQKRQLWSVRILLFSCVWFWCTTGLNALIERRAQAQPTREGLESLVESSGTSELVFFNNFAYRLTAESLNAVGMKGRPSIVFLPDMLPTTRLPVATWGERFDVEERMANGQPGNVFWSGKRALFKNSEALRGSFAYTRRPLGAFAPLTQSSNDRMPSHNYIEDMRLNTYKEGRSPLQNILAETATRQAAFRNHYYLIAPEIFSLPNRVWMGLPIFESYAFDVEIWGWGTP